MTEYGSYDPDQVSYLAVHEWLILQRELNLDTLQSIVKIQMPYEDFLVIYAIRIGMYPDDFELCLQALEGYEEALTLVYDDEDSTFLKYIIVHD